MSSLSNTQYNSRSMNGLINVNANTGTFTDIAVNNLTINQSGTAPTMPFADNSTHIATTAFVQGHTSGNYVDLTNTQTITGQKTFGNANTYFSGNLKSTSVATNYIDFDDGTANEFMNVYAKNLTFNTAQSVDISAGGFTTFSSPSNVYIRNPTSNTKLVQIIDTNNTQLELQTAPSSNTIRSNTNLSFPVTGNYTISPTGIFSASSGNTSDMNIGTAQTTGILNIGQGGARTGAVNIATNTPSNAPIRIGSTTSSTQLTTIRGADLRLNSDLTLTNNTVTIGSGATWSTLNLNGIVNVNGLTTFNNGATFDNFCPSSLIAPTTANHLTTKNYVDTEIAGGLTGYVNISGTQTITGAKTFNNFAVSQTAGTDISMSINNVGSDSMYLNFGTSQSLRMHYVNALNRLQINGTSATREVAFGVNGNSYIIMKPSTLTLTLNAPTTELGGGLTMFAGANFTFIPVGTINTSVVATVPTGFLLCNGQAVSRTIYVALFSAIGTTFGAGDGVNTFNVPDFEGAFLRGAGSQTVGGVTYTAPAIGTAQQDQVLNANYASNEGFRDCAGGTRSCVSRTRITGDPVDTNTGILAQFPRQGTENRPFNYSVYYYIKF